MKTKLFTLFLALITSVEFVFASNTKVGNIWYDFDDVNNTASVTYKGTYDNYINDGYSGAVSIPATVSYNGKTYSVTSIGESAFHHCENLTSVRISNSITSIGYEAFYMCHSLKTVNFGNGIITIGERVFCSCESLKSISLPNSVTSIGYGAFGGCTGLTSVTIPNSVTNIGFAAFSGCSGLTSPVYNEHIFAFLPTSYSGSYTILDGIETIAGWAFSGCTALTSLNIPCSVTSIGEHAFSSCSGLTSVNIPNSIDSIREYTFSGCTALTSLNIPNSVKSIGDRAFYCSGLTSVNIPNSIDSIEYDAFSGCIGLTVIDVDGSNPTYDSRDGCNAIIETSTNTLIAGCSTTIIPNSVTSIGRGAFKGCTSLTSINIPNSVTSIGSAAFYNCVGLTSVTIPNSVTRIDDEAFYGWYMNISTVTCYATTPPNMGTIEGASVFPYGSISLYVPKQSVAAYKTANQWKNFNPIQPISALPAETTIINIVPSDRSVDITWPSIANAASYELVIKDKSGNVICTLVFNGQGQLLSISFNAPARDNSEQQTQTAGFQFTVTGLDSGTEYDYTITAKDANGDDLNIESGSFTTTGGDNNPTGLEETQNKDRSSKILRNGQILIHRGDRTYTLTGAEVK